ncbi:hypothetical protein Tsubulata_045537, partial [Turnera subulata]
YPSLSLSLSLSLTPTQTHPPTHTHPPTQFAMDVSLPAWGWHSDQGNSGSDSGPIPWGLATQFGGFKGWSLSGWRRFDIRQLGRRPSSINDAPSWHKDAHVRQRPSILKFLDIEGDNYGYSDEERVVGEEEEEVVAAGRDSWIRDHLTSRYGHHGAQAVSDIIKYYFDTSARLHRGDFQVNPPVPDQLWEEHIRCRVACPLPFNSRHPLYADYTGHCRVPRQDAGGLAWKLPSLRLWIWRTSPQPKGWRYLHSNL